MNFYRSVKTVKTLNKFSNNFGRINKNINQKQFFHKNNFKFEPIVPFNLADIGEGIKEVEIIQWFLKEGDSIEQFDKVAEVQSDKANVEITSRYKGIITKVHHKVGDIAQVGFPLIDIEVSDSDVKVETTPTTKKEENKKETKVEVTKEITNESFEKVKTTPSVRRIAREENINLSQVVATGKDGRILKQDVLEFLENKDKPKTSTTSTSTKLIVEEDEEIPVRGLMRTMIKTMEAANQVPQLGYSDEIILDELIKLRSELKKVAEERNIKLSFMPFFIKASSLALNQYPILNSQLNSEKTILTYKVNSFNFRFLIFFRNHIILVSL